MRVTEPEGKSAIKSIREGRGEIQSLCERLVRVDLLDAHAAREIVAQRAADDAVEMGSDLVHLVEGGG